MIGPAEVCGGRRMGEWGNIWGNFRLIRKISSTLGPSAIDRKRRVWAVHSIILDLGLNCADHITSKYAFGSMSFCWGYGGI